MGEIILPEPNLLGDHQIYNISTSIAASRKMFNIKDEHIKKGITKMILVYFIVVIIANYS